MNRSDESLRDVPASDTSAPLIVTQQLEMSFQAKLPVLTGVSLSIVRGDFVSILGPSGCGKSTLLRLAAGLLTPVKGTIAVDGQLPLQARRTSTRVAFVFQEPTLLPWRTVAQNIALPLELNQVSTTEQQARIEQSLDLIGLTAADATKRPRQLSGGQRMRVSLARALVTQPSLLLMDEPFAALDDVLRQDLDEELVRLWRAQGMTVVFVTHNVAEAVFLSQRVLVMSRRPGTIVGEFEIPFGVERSPELRGTPEFAALTARIATALRQSS